MVDLTGSAGGSAGVQKLTVPAASLRRQPMENLPSRPSSEVLGAHGNFSMANGQTKAVESGLSSGALGYDSGLQATRIIGGFKAPVPTVYSGCSVVTTSPTSGDVGHCNVVTND